MRAPAKPWTAVASVSATPPWRRAFGSRHRCECLTLPRPQSPPKAAWRLRFPPHSNAPDALPSVLLFLKDGIIRRANRPRLHPRPAPAARGLQAPFARRAQPRVGAKPFYAASKLIQRAAHRPLHRLDHMRIDLRRRDRRMPEPFLDAADGTARAQPCRHIGNLASQGDMPTAAPICQAKTFTTFFLTGKLRPAFLGIRNPPNSICQRHMQKSARRLRVNRMLGVLP